MKAAAWAGKTYNTVGAEIGGWLHGRMGGGADYLRDQDIIDSQAKAARMAALAGPTDTGIRQLGELSMYGSQSAVSGKRRQHRRSHGRRRH